MQELGRARRPPTRNYPATLDLRPHSRQRATLMSSLAHLPRRSTAAKRPQRPLLEQAALEAEVRTPCLPQHRPHRATRLPLRAAAIATATIRDRRPTTARTDLQFRTRRAILWFAQGRLAFCSRVLWLWSLRCTFVSDARCCEPFSRKDEHRGALHAVSHSTVD